MQIQPIDIKRGFVTVPVPKQNNCCDITMVEGPAHAGKDAAKARKAEQLVNQESDQKTKFDLVGLAG